MDENQLEDMSKNLNMENEGLDKNSTITEDMLKRFNDIYGYENRDEDEEQDQVNELDGNPNEGEALDEMKDEVHSLRSKQSH